MPKNKHKSSGKGQSNHIVLNTFIVFLAVTAICFGIIFYVVFISDSPQTLKAPTSSPEQTYETHQTTTDNKEKNNSKPVFSKASASSTREPYKTNSGTISYSPSNAFDKNKSTVWTPSEDDSKPWIEISSAKPQTVKGIEIENGHSKSKDLYYKNNRAKEVIVECDTIRYSYTLQDKGNGKTQRLVFPEPMETTKIRITINSYYRGTDYNDLCITQITPY